jgi:dihydroceramide fatty acyl 2-hydroxylase
LSDHQAPRAFTRAWFGYWQDLIIFPVAAALVALVYCRSWTWAAIVPAGFAFWTFAEYWMHRSVLHGCFWHGVHERHHKHPSEWIVFPWWHTPTFFGSGFVVTLLAEARVAELPSALYCGFVLGYVWFQIMHHWLHHTDVTRWAWLHRYSDWHDRHHAGGPCNYGITTPVWDIVFRTSR